MHKPGCSVQSDGVQEESSIPGIAKTIRPANIFTTEESNHDIRETNDDDFGNDHQNVCGFQKLDVTHLCAATMCGHFIQPAKTDFRLSHSPGAPTPAHT